MRTRGEGDDVKAMKRFVKEQHMTVEQALVEAGKRSTRSSSALRRAYFRADKKAVLRKGKAVLTEEEEKTLALVCLGFSGAHYPLNSHLVLFAVRALFDKQPSTRWPPRFLLRHPELSRRRAKHMKEARDAPRLLDEVEQFIAAVEEHRKAFVLEPRCVVNCDETVVKLSSDGELVFEKRGRKQSQAHGACSALGSLLPFVAADGSVVCTFWVQKGHFGGAGSAHAQEEPSANVALVTPKGKGIQRGKWTRHFVFSDTGYVNSDVFEACVRQFVTEWHAKCPGERVWLFADQLSAHKRIEVTSWALRQRVELWFFPANASHFIQPLDGAPFAVMKRELAGKAYETKVLAKFSHSPLNASFFALAFAAEERALQPQVIRAGFHETGIVPWRPDLIRARAKENAGEQVENEEEALLRRVTDAATQVVRAFAEEGKARCASVQAQNVQVKRNRTYNPRLRIKDNDKLQQEREIAARKAAEKKAEQARLRAQREAAKESRKAVRMANTCRAPECSRVRRGGRAWEVCDVCGACWCATHKGNFRNHHHDEDQQ